MFALTLSVMFFSRNCDWNGNVFFSFLVLDSRAYPVTKKNEVVAICDFLRAPQGTFRTQLALICLVVTSQHHAIILCARGALDGTWWRAWDRERSPCGLRTRLHTKETIPRFIRTFESTPRTSPSTPLYTTSKLSSHWPIRDRKLSLRVRGVHSWLYIARRRADACSAKLSAAHPSWNA